MKGIGEYSGLVRVFYADGNGKPNERVGEILVVTNTHIKLAVSELILTIDRRKIEKIERA